VAEAFFELRAEDQREILELGRAATGRPAHLLEKDIWVVWALRTLFESQLATDLTFKGGTLLSKVYKIIDRFSEDIDLTYDVRKLIPDLVGDRNEIPASRSQANKWTKAVRRRLPGWIVENVQPILQDALTRDCLNVRLELGGPAKDKLLLHYPALTQGTGYVAPIIILEFGARATGEPHEVTQVACDIASGFDGVSFPVAAPLVMNVARTFWEKATAAHVFCAQGRTRGERYARHWHDLAAISRSPYFTDAIANEDVAVAVARHKSCFFIEKDGDGQVIDYMAAVSGYLNLVPQGAARTALMEDYAAMLADAVMVGDALSFDELLTACHNLEMQINNKGSHTKLQYPLQSR